MLKNNTKKTIKAQAHQFSDQNRNAALDAAAHDLRVFPVHVTRHPKNPHKKKAEILVKSWAKDASTDPVQINEWWDANPNAVPGMPTGDFLVIDLDERDGKDGSAEYKAMGLDPEAALFAVDTPSGGEHLYFENSIGLSISQDNIAPGIDTRGKGGFVFAPGARTIFGEYRIKRGDLNDLQFGCLTQVPEPVRQALSKPKEPASQPVPGNANLEKVRDALSYVSSDCGYDEWVDILMAVHHATGGSKHGLALVFGWSAGHQQFTFKEVQTKWRSFGKKDGAQITIDTLFARARENGWQRANPDDLLTGDDVYGALDAETQAAIEELVGPISEAVVPIRFGEGKAIMRGNKPVINLHNTTLYLSRNLDAILPGLAHNQMTGRDEWRDGQITDAVVSIARMALEKRGLETVGKELVADAAKTVALKLAYHPIRNDLHALQWDGIPRLDEWLVRHAAADDTPYTRAVSRKFLIAMVARVMQPGCKHDHTLVLSGEQGQNKSKMCKVLAGEQYFSETLPSIRSDKTDAIRHLQGKWLVELAELAPSRTSDAEDLKAFMSGAVDRVRMPYAKFDEAFPRQCVFVGTTNDDQFLRDATGGLRFWPVAVRRVIDVDSLADERDQLFAEAVAAFKAGERWWLDRQFEAEHAAPMQAAAYVSDSWIDDVASWLDKPRDHLDDESEIKMEITISKVLSDALGVPTERQTMALQKRTANVLRQLGWIKKKTKNGIKWRRPE
jgi:hypothetical protein